MLTKLHRILPLALSLVTAFAIVGCDQPDASGPELGLEVDDDIEAAIAAVEVEVEVSSSDYVHAYLAAAEELEPGITADLDPAHLSPEQLLDLLSREQLESELFQDTIDSYLGNPLADLSPSTCPGWTDPWCSAFYSQNVYVAHCDGGIKCEVRTNDANTCNNYDNPCVSCWYTPACL